MNETSFYNDLRALQLPISQIFRDEHFTDVPTGWHVVISDVKNSTQAVAAGRHNDVNLAAAGSLIAALNVARKESIDVPFFFGGDGSTLLVPDSLLKDVLAALAAHSLNTVKNFGLDMHAGSISVDHLKQNGCLLKIAKLEIDSAFNKAIAIGDGLAFAEQQIKQSSHNELRADLEVLNLDGLECRWNKVKPAKEEAGNVCYLIEAVDRHRQLEVYANVFATIDEIYGDLQMRNPLSVERLKPLSLLNFEKLRNEMLAKFGRWKTGFFTINFLKTAFGALALKYNWRLNGLSGKEYLVQLIAHADTLTIDTRINTIICGTTEKHQLFLSYLNTKEKEGQLIFGDHGSKESIMTCYIENRNARHIHFVDGADGGYTEAAKEFKKKRKNIHLLNTTSESAFSH